MLEFAFAICMGLSSCAPARAAILPNVPTLPMPAGIEQGNRKARRRDAKLFGR